MESDEWHVWDQVSPRSELVGDSYQHREWLYMYVAEVQRGAPADRGEQIEECMRVVRMLFERTELTIAVDNSSIIVPAGCARTFRSAER